jgi:type I restriction enzyme M protein
MNNTASIVSRVWSFCHTLRDDGVSYGDYLEQLKSRTRPSCTRSSI